MIASMLVLKPVNINATIPQSMSTLPEVCPSQKGALLEATMKPASHGC